MKTNKEIVTEIIEDLEKTVGLNWPIKINTKINRKLLIKCWSEYRKEAEYSYYGYTTSAGLNFTLRNIFINVNKSSREPWKAYILKLYKYKYCAKCEKLYTLNSFDNNISEKSGKAVTCKYCMSSIKKYYYKENKEKLNKYGKHWCVHNRDKRNATEAGRRAAKLQRTPSWLNEDDQWMIKEIYSLAKQREELTGIKWHVDHIIPLQGELVCGLHVPTNLQVITATENLSKGNNFII